MVVAVAPRPRTVATGRGRLLGLRYGAAVPPGRLGGPAVPAMRPSVDHPEADQDKHCSTDRPTHGGSLAVVPDADRKKGNGQRQPRPVEGPAQSRGYRRLVHGLILTGARVCHRIRVHFEHRTPTCGLVLIRSIMRHRQRRSTGRCPRLIVCRGSALVGALGICWCPPLVSADRLPPRGSVSGWWQTPPA